MYLPTSTLEPANKIPIAMHTKRFHISTAYVFYRPQQRKTRAKNVWYNITRNTFNTFSFHIHIRSKLVWLNFIFSRTVNGTSNTHYNCTSPNSTVHEGSVSTTTFAVDRLEAQITPSQNGERGGRVNQAYCRLSTTHGHITDCKLDTVVYAGVCVVI